MKKANNNSNHDDSKQDKPTGETPSAAAKKSAQQPKEWVKANDPTRPEPALFFKNFKSAASVPLTGSIADQVNALYRAAIDENAELVVFLAAFKEGFDKYYEDKTFAYSGPNPTFTAEGIEGCAAKVSDLRSITEMMRDEFVIGKNGKVRRNTLWLGLFDARLGGLSTHMTNKVNLARKRTYKQEYDRTTGETRHFDRNLVGAKGTSMDINEEGRRLPEDLFAIEADPLGENARGRVEWLDESHRRSVRYLRLVVDLFLGWSAASRREWLPYLLEKMDKHSVTPEEAGLPADMLKHRAHRGEKELPYPRQLAFDRLVKLAIERGPGLDDFDCCLVAA